MGEGGVGKKGYVEGAEGGGVVIGDGGERGRGWGWADVGGGCSSYSFNSLWWWYWWGEGVVEI